MNIPPVALPVMYLLKAEHKYIGRLCLYMYGGNVPASPENVFCFLHLLYR